MELICSTCGHKVEAGELFSEVMVMSDEKEAVVTKVEIAIVRKAEKIFCENYM